MQNIRTKSIKYPSHMHNLYNVKQLEAWKINCLNERTQLFMVIDYLWREATHHAVATAVESLPLG